MPLLLETVAVRALLVSSSASFLLARGANRLDAQRDVGLEDRLLIVEILRLQPSSLAFRNFTSARFLAALGWDRLSMAAVLFLLLTIR